MSQELQEFITKAREQSLSDEEILAALVDNGWSETQAKLALKGLAVPTPEAKEAAQPKQNEPNIQKQPALSPLSAALHHIFLWFFTAASSLAIGAAVASAFNRPVSGQALAAFIAVVLVTLAVYGSFYMSYARRATRPPFVTANKVWSIITICIHGVGAMAAAITLIVMAIVGGSGIIAVTAALILALDLAVLVTYIAATFMKPESATRRTILKVVMQAVFAALLLLCDWSLVAYSGVRHDQDLREDLVATQKAVRDYTTEHDALPESGDDITITGDVTYERISGKTYNLCGVFKRSGTDYDYGRDKTYTPSDNYITEYEFTASGAGKQCFAFESSHLVQLQEDRDRLQFYKSY